MFSKLTDCDFTTKLDIKDKEFGYFLARNRELMNDEILQTMLDSVLGGESDKDRIYEETLSEHP
jgi:hypothetical protein